MGKNYLTTASGSVNWTTTTIWSNLAVPATADELTLLNSAAALGSGFAQGAVLLAKLDVPQTFTGSVGIAAQTIQALSSIAASGTTATATVTSHGYSTGDVVRISGCTNTVFNGVYSITTNTANTFTYTTASAPGGNDATATANARKEDYLNIGVTTWVIGYLPSGSVATGSQRLKFNFGTNTTTGFVYATGNSTADTNLEPLRVLMNNASSAVTVAGGTVGIATTRPDETATLGTVTVAGSSAKVNLGPGVTYTTGNISGGSLTMASGCTTLTVTGGTAYTLPGDYAFTTVSVGPGTLNANHVRTGTNASISTFYGYDKGILDLTDSSANASTPFRITDFYYYPGFQVKTNPAVPGQLVVTNWHPVGINKVEYT